MVAGQFPFGKHQGAGCVRGNKLPEGFTSLTRSISKSPWAYISVMTWLLIKAPERGDPHLGQRWRHLNHAPLR
jgi:hypothetical protein